MLESDLGWTAVRVEALLAVSAAMLGLFLYAETRAVEPLIPLTLFHNPIISLCSICVFVLGMGMFGVIIYLPLFMQGVLGLTATESGNLMMPLMMGVVFGTAISGQLMARLGTYKGIAMVGSVMVAAGMILFAQMTPTTARLEVLTGMVLAGFGMGLVMPVYTVAVQNVAPRPQLGAATAATIFFRSIGSTVGVAVFGSVMLMNYHHDLAERIPASAPSNTLGLLSNPMLLSQMRPQLEAAFRDHGGQPVLQALLASVAPALARGLHLIFVASAVLMVASVFLHAGIKNLRLRGAAPAVEPEAVM